MEKEALEKIIRKLEARRSAYDAAIEDLLYLKDKKSTIFPIRLTPEAHQILKSIAKNFIVFCQNDSSASRMGYFAVWKLAEKFGRKGVIFGIWPKDIFGQMPDADFDNAAVVTYIDGEKYIEVTEDMLHTIFQDTLAETLTNVLRIED